MGSREQRPRSSWKFWVCTRVLGSGVGAVPRLSRQTPPSDRLHINDPFSFLGLRMLTSGLVYKNGFCVCLGTRENPSVTLVRDAEVLRDLSRVSCDVKGSGGGDRVLSRRRGKVGCGWLQVTLLGWGGWRLEKPVTHTRKISDVFKFLLRCQMATARNNRPRYKRFLCMFPDLAFKSKSF